MVLLATFALVLTLTLGRDFSDLATRTPTLCLVDCCAFAIF